MAEFSERVVVIVGGGYSGTATAINLLRHDGGRGLRVLLIERGAQVGCGLAYGSAAYPYPLNVPASRMSASVADPDEFLRFAAARLAGVTGEDFLPRALYGEYLQHKLQDAVNRAPAGSSLERVRAEVVDVTVAGGAAVVRLARGRELHADEVVLAPGSPLPTLPASVRCTVAPPLLRRDPWTPGEVPVGRGPLLVIGTGLTMVDVVCAAVSRDPGVRIHAISRHGLVPPSQTQFRPDALGDQAGQLALAGGSVRRLMHIVRRLARAAEQGGGDWREVITLVRREAPTLWQGLAIAERERFLRHVRLFWDIHRHRIPGVVLARIDALRAAGQLSIHAGRLESLEAHGNAIRAQWRERRTGAHRRLDAAEVVNCSGPDYDVTRSREPLWMALLARGLVVPDPLHLGIRTAAGGTVVTRDGGPAARLSYIGPMLRADYWEATAVGELRVRAQQLADRLLATLGAQ